MNFGAKDRQWFRVMCPTWLASWRESFVHGQAAGSTRHSSAAPAAKAWKLR